LQGLFTFFLFKYRSHIVSDEVAEEKTPDASGGELVAAPAHDAAISV
jgi:hypothetical protein